MYFRILKNSAASTKAWLSRDRAGYKKTMADTGLLAHYAKYNDPKASEADAFQGLTEQEKSEVLWKMDMAKKAMTTDKQYSKKGVYTDDRQKLHNEIIDRFLSDEAIQAATPAPGEQPTYILLGGRGGSGKSAFTDGTINEFDASKFLKLDTDAIKEQLIPPYQGWNAFSVHQESTEIFDAITFEAQKRGLNIIHDSTLRSDDIGSTVAQIKKSGYRVEGHYMFLPRQVAAKRAIQRYLGKGPDERGRLVPPQVVLDNTDNERNFEKLSHYFDNWSAYDNQGPKGSIPKLINKG